jgi:hypothetical protein
MTETGLEGPYKFDNETIDREVVGISPGAYALGHLEPGTFYVHYVGRSDDNVNARLKGHLGEKYTDFEFRLLDSPEEAFEKECNLWHDFLGPEGRLDNKVHPDRPEGKDWKCPRCNAFDQ